MQVSLLYLYWEIYSRWTRSFLKYYVIMRSFHVKSRRNECRGLVRRSGVKCVVAITSS